MREAIVLHLLLFNDLQQRRRAIKPKGAQAHLNHRPALRVHRQGADINIQARFVNVADCVVELAQGCCKPFLVMLPSGVYGVGHRLAVPCCEEIVPSSDGARDRYRSGYGVSCGNG